MHFTFQTGFLTRIPSIYHPHDLQHVHLPENFTWLQRRARDASYRVLCVQASMVAVASRWVMRDVVEHLGVPEEKVRVIPLAPIVEHYAQPDAAAITRLRAALALPERFALYPAQTWPHKNHLRLLEAMALVRERFGYTIPLVACGRKSDFAAEIERHARKLSLGGALHLVGFVEPEQLQALYGMARCVVVPSLFEAASFPLWEAFRNRVPAACANVTSLPEQAGDAALLFDPRDTRGMADALARVWGDESLRARLVENGLKRLTLFSLERTARLFRAHYRRLAGRAIPEEDAALMAAPPPM
jgi:glycosyltransferase involved in cell wall biosynthesis